MDNSRTVRAVSQEHPTAPLAALRPGAKSTSDFVFPIEFHNTEGNHFIKFSAVRYNRENRNVNAIKIAEARISLPIPANLSTAYGANWGEVDLGIGGKKIAEGGGGKIGQAAIAAIQGEGGRAAEIVGSIKKSDVAELVKDFQPTIIRNITQALGDFTGIKAVEGAQLFLGKAINPHQAVLFQGVGFRTHSFTYNFVAKTQQESIAIRDIVNIFKFAMHPDITDDNSAGTVFEFPHEWTIEFSKGIRNYLYDFTPCVLTGFNVTYNGSGIPAFYERTGAPVQINISLTFKEVEIITKTKLEAEFTEQGFGAETTTRSGALAIAAGEITI